MANLSPQCYDGWTKKNDAHPEVVLESDMKLVLRERTGASATNKTNKNK